MAPIELREIIRRLEVRLVLSEKSEMEAQRQCASLKGQIAQLEKQLVLKQVTDIRRREGQEDLEELLGEERRRRSALHDELRQVRLLLHSERDEHHLQLEQLKSVAAENARRIISLERAVSTAASGKDTLQALIDTLTVERDTAEEAYHALYEESNVAMANALAEQEFVHRLSEVSRSPQISDEPAMRICPQADEEMTRNTSGSVFGSLSAANDAWLGARSELDAVKIRFAQSERRSAELQSDRDSLAVEVKALQISIGALRSAHTEISSQLETKLFELSDEQSRVGELEALLRDANASKDLASSELTRVLNGKQLRTFSSQTSLTTVSLAALENQAAAGENAREALAAERVIWSGRIRAAEVKCEAMKSLRAGTPLPAATENLHQDKELRTANTALRGQVAELQRQQKRHDGSLEALTSENSALKERIQRLQGIVSAAIAQPHIVSSIDSATPSPPRRGVTQPASVHENEQRVLNALDEAAVLRETAATREIHITQMSNNIQQLRQELDRARAELNLCNESLLAAQQQGNVLTREMEDVRQGSEVVKLQHEASESTLEAANDTARVHAIALREAYDVMHAVLHVLHTGLSSTSSLIEGAQPPTQTAVPLDILLHAAQEASSQIKALHAQHTEWEDASLWLLDQLHEISRWLRQGPVVQLLSATNTSLLDSHPDTTTTLQEVPFIKRLELLLQQRRSYQTQAAAAAAAFSSSPSPHRSSDSRRRSASPYSGSGHAMQRASTPTTIGEDSTVAQPPQTVMDTVSRIRYVLGVLLDSIAAQNLEMATMRKSMYDVKTAFLAEMEAREELEVQLQLATSGEGLESSKINTITNDADDLSVEIRGVLGS